MARPDRDAGTIKVLGARQLRTSLKAAGDDFRDLKDLHRQIAHIISDAAKGRAPVSDRSIRPGRLRDSIRPAGTKTAAIVRIGKKSVPYANAIHWGRAWWPNKKTKRHIAKIPGRPFVSEAAQATERQWQALYTTRIDEILNRIEGNSS